MHIPSFLIIADRGQLLAYTVDRSTTRPTARLVFTDRFIEGHTSPREQHTDRDGNFHDASHSGVTNSGPERMTLSAELEMRIFRQAAQRIVTLLREHQPASWGFAAPSEINGAILDGLPAHILARLEENLTLDLINTPANRLLEHFERAHA